MTSLHVLVLLMPFLVLGLVLVTAAIIRWQDKREEQRSPR
jgi:hypothetical protein